MHEQDLYIKKPNGRYQKVDYRFIDVVRIPNDKQVMVIKHSKNGKSFYYDSIDVKEEELKLLAKTRVYKDTLTNIILLHSAPKFTFGNGSWSKPNDESNKLTPVQLDSVLFYTISNPYWKKSEYTLKNLENSGKLSSLSNQKLKDKLYEYSLAVTDITDKDEDATIGFNHLLDYYKENGSLRNLDASGNHITEGRTPLKYNHIKFFSDLVFESAIDDCLVYIRQRIERYNIAKTIIIEIISITNNSND